MKRWVVLLMFLVLPAAALAQWGTLRGPVGLALGRVEQALRTGSPGSIEDMFGTHVTLRLGDSLYTDVSSIQAAQTLRQFFTDRQVVRFDPGLAGTGLLITSQGGKQDTARVDVWLQRGMGGPSIRALNISNYPLATVFFDRRPGE